MKLLECQNVCKTYKEGTQEISVLNNVSFTLNKGEQLAILGSSGSGKSTLLHLLGALDTPSDGAVIFEQQNIFHFNQKQQARFRNQSLGFVYQFHHLLPEFSALENVCMPLLIAKYSMKAAEVEAKKILDKVGLSHRLTHKPAELSGGERQRVAIARSLVTHPKLVLADEPTGNLDDKTGETIYQLLRDLKREIETSFVIVTHDKKLADKSDKKLELTNGQLSEVEITGSQAHEA